MKTFNAYCAGQLLDSVEMEPTPDISDENLRAKAERFLRRKYGRDHNMIVLCTDVGPDALALACAASLEMGAA